MADPPERRRRRSRYPSSVAPWDTSPTDSAPPAGRRSASAPEVRDPAPPPVAPPRRPLSRASAEERETERSLRGLVGSGASQVSVSAALRARDASRPGEAELAEAEQRLVIVRRHWVPRDELPRGGGRSS